MDIMASLPSVVAIVNGADLDPSNIPEVESLFAQFACLSPAEKDDQRGSFVDRVFPLFFGDNAVIDGSSACEAQRPSPMVKQLLAPTAGSGACSPRPPSRSERHYLFVGFSGSSFPSVGGGHSPNIGWNKDKLAAEIGAGLRWMHVYKALDLYGLAVAGGRFPTVGVSGLLLGGGLSFRHGVNGIGAMGVSNYEVITMNNGST